MQPAQECVPASLTAILRRQPHSPGRTQLAWRVAAGPAVARATEAELDERGVLRVRTSDGHWRREVDRGRDLLLRRLQELLGPRAVVRLQLD